MKKIAVIMSVYKNDELLHLQECVKSILSQTYPDFDLHIQLDGKISETCENYLDSLTDKRIFKYSREENRGLAYSLNELLERVLPMKYEYVARMDADDICVKDRFEKQMEYMEIHSEIDIAGSMIEEFYEDGSSKQIRYPICHEEMRRFFGKRNPLAHVTVMFRSTYFQKAGLYPIGTNLDEDTMFWLKGFQKGCRFANVDAILIKVRVNNNFFFRRNGFKKSYADFSNRCLVIARLQLSVWNYIPVLGRFLVLSLPVPALTRLAYKLLR